MHSKWTAYAIGILMAFDIIGTPLAVFSIAQTNSFSHEANQRTVQSRYEDCQAQEIIRRLSRKRLVQKERELSQTLKLLHIAPTPYVLHLSKRQTHEERRQVAPVNCTEYADRAKA